VIFVGVITNGAPSKEATLLLLLLLLLLMLLPREVVVADAGTVAAAIGAAAIGAAGKEMPKSASKLFALLFEEEDIMLLLLLNVANEAGFDAFVVVAEVDTGRDNPNKPAMSSFRLLPWFPPATDDIEEDDEEDDEEDEEEAEEEDDDDDDDDDDDAPSSWPTRPCFLICSESRGGVFSRSFCFMLPIEMIWRYSFARCWMSALTLSYRLHFLWGKKKIITTSIKLKLK
jgi:hypothetical protein